MDEEFDFSDVVDKPTTAGKTTPEEFDFSDIVDEPVKKKEVTPSPVSGTPYKLLGERSATPIPTVEPRTDIIKTPYQLSGELPNIEGSPVPVPFSPDAAGADGAVYGYGVDKPQPLGINTMPKPTLSATPQDQAQIAESGRIDKNIQAERAYKEATKDSGQSDFSHYLGTINQALYAAPADVLDAAALGVAATSRGLNKTLGSTSFWEKNNLADFNPKAEDTWEAKAAKWYRDAIAELNPTNPSMRAELKTQAVSALGNLASLAMTGGATTTAKLGLQGAKEAGALSKFASELASPVSAQGGIQMGLQGYKDAKAHGASDETAFNSFLKQGAVGSVLERIPIQLFYKRLDATTGGGLKTLLKKGFSGGTEEAVTEILQQGYSNLDAKQSYDKTRKILDGVGASGGIGFGLGFMLNALGVSLRKKRELATTPKDIAHIDAAINLVNQNQQKVYKPGDTVEWAKSQSFQNNPTIQPNEQPPTATPVEPGVAPTEDVNSKFLNSLNEKELQAEHADAVSRGDQQWASTVEQVAQQKGIPLTTQTNENTLIPSPNPGLLQNNNGMPSGDRAAGIPVVEDAATLQNPDAISPGETITTDGKSPSSDPGGLPSQEEAVTFEQPLTNPPNETRTAEQSTTPQNDNAGITGLEGVAAQEGTGREAEGNTAGAIAGQQTIDLTEIGQAVKFEHGDGTMHNGTVVANYPDGSVQVKAHNGRIYTVKPDKLRETPYSAFQRTGLISVTPNLGFVSDLIDLIPRAKRLVQQQLMSRGLLPQSVFNRLNQANAEAKSITKQIDYTSADLRRAMKKDFGPNPTPAQIASVDEVLRGVQPATILSSRLAKVVIEMRSQVDALSNAMISSGSVQGKSVATIQQNLGTYLTRSYRVFDDKNYGPDKVDQQVMNNAVAFVRGQFPQATPDQIDGYIRGFLMEKGEQSPIQLIKQGKLGSKDISILKQRKDIPPEIRALMGEYADPLLNYARSVTRMASLVANQKFLTDVRTMGLNKFLFEGEIPPDNVHVKRIASEDSKTFNPLNGLWTTPDIAEAFQKMGSGPSAESAFMKIYNPVNYALKHGLTVFSPITHVRNFTSNFWVAIANGHFDVTKAVSAAKTIATDLGNLSKDAYREKYKKYASLGIVQDGSRSEELRAVLKDIIKDGDGAFPHLEDSRVKKILNSLKTGVQNAYAAEDEVWKIFGYENEYQRYRRALPHLSDAEVEQMAAQNIRDTYPTYSLTPELVRQFRKAPLVGTFVAFPSEIIRTSFNIAALTKKELSTPGLRSIGLQRLSGMAMAASAPYIINALTQKWYGVDDEEDKELALFKASYAKNAQDAYIARPKEGVYKYIDMSYSDPYAYLRKPLMALLQDDSLEERAIEATWEAASPFLSPEILALSIGEVVFNKQKNSGREVYNEQLPPGDKAKAAFLYVTGKTTPGFIKTGKELYKGVAGETNEYGKAYNAKETLAKVFTGQKIETLDVGENLGFKIRGFQRKLIEAKQIFTSVDRKTVPQSKKDEAKIKSEEAIAKLMESMQKAVKAAIKLGVPANVVYKMVEGARINQENTAKILGSSPSTTGAERSGVSRERQGTERKAVERQAVEP